LAGVEEFKVGFDFAEVTVHLPVSDDEKFSVDHLFFF